jgi:hypothetical protein
VVRGYGIALTIRRSVDRVSARNCRLALGRTNCAEVVVESAAVPSKLAMLAHHRNAGLLAKAFLSTAFDHADDRILEGLSPRHPDGGEIVHLYCSIQES